MKKLFFLFLLVLCFVQACGMTQSGSYTGADTPTASESGPVLKGTVVDPGSE